VYPPASQDQPGQGDADREEQQQGRDRAGLGCVRVLSHRYYTMQQLFVIMSHAARMSSRDHTLRILERQKHFAQYNDLVSY
jgi:hypothetical protein